MSQVEWSICNLQLDQDQQVGRRWSVEVNKRVIFIT